MAQYYLHFGTGDEPRQTIAVESREKPLWWQEKGLVETPTGYGRRLTSSTQIKWAGRWRRVYVYCFSNSGTAYIGKPGAWLATVSRDY